MAEGQWFSYLQLPESFKVDKRNCSFEHRKAEFEIELCTNDEHVNC